MRKLFVCSFAAVLLILSGCNSGSKPISVTILSPMGAQALDLGQNFNIMVQVNNDKMAKGATFNLMGVGMLTNTTANSATYNAPQLGGAGGNATITIASATDPMKSVTINVVVTSPPNISNNSSTLAAAIQGVAYAGASVTVTGGAGTLTYSITAGALPTGLNLSSSTGAISGTATASPGTYNFTVQVKDGSTVSPQMSSKAFSITVNQQPTITSAANATFVVNSLGTFTVTSTASPTAALMESGPLPAGVTFTDNGDGTATIKGTPTVTGNFPITITASNGIGTNGTQNFTLTVGQAPSITSGAATTLTVGTAGNFSITTGGFPPPSLTETGNLPTGVMFVDNGNGTAKLTGTPAAGTGGTYNLTIKAHNGVGTDAMQVFVLTVDQAPAVTSANATSFTVGVSGNFMVTTSGFPKPALTELGALPSGVSFVDNGNGTATISGPPGAGTANNYAITITANNGIAPNGTQAFTLTVGQGPTISSAAATTFTVGSATTFNITTSGFPAPALTETGALPGGVMFVDNGNGTAKLTGTPAAATGGTYNISIKAHNGFGTDAVQAFVLTVDQAPAVTSATSATFSVGALGNFMVTTTGFPTPALTETGSLPTGVMFVDNHNGTATIMGTATVQGMFPITITANNGIAPNGTQMFTLTVNTAPAFTSPAAATFTVGMNGSFTVTTTGTPTPSLSETGALPANVMFHDNGDGTATLSGTPAANTGGTYNITVKATNASGSTNQPFVLTVDQAPTITSPTSTTFTENVFASFTVMTTGFPKPALSELGALPTGVMFVDNHDGTATLSGTPATGTSNSYPITITANNGVAPNGTQAFTLTVNTAPVITSGTSTTFTVGTLGSFTVTTTGSPTPTLTETGALPTGVMFVDNGNGTAKLSGTPAAGTGKTYPITIKASSASGNNSQAFTLTVNEAPTITSANSTLFTVGTNGNFMVTTSGFPKPALSEVGALPTGVSFVDNGNGTATISGPPAAGTANNYAITITANNGIAPNGTQGFTLMVVNNTGVTCGSGQEGVFKGQYTILFQGFDANGPVAIGATFDADGTGKIAKLVGVIDINTSTGVQTNVSINSAGSSYSVGLSNGGYRGCLTIATGSATYQFAFSLGSLNGSNIATKGRLIEVDSSGTLGSGELRLQDATAFSTGAISAGGNFGFGAASPLSTSGVNRFAVIGSANLSNPAAITGEEDFNFDGQADGGSTTGAAAQITGGSVSVSANGRGTLSITVGAIGSFAGSTFNFSVYVVSATEFLFMNVGAQSANNPLFAGRARQQSGGFSTSSLNADMVLYAAGICSTCGTGGGPGPQLTVGVITISSPGNFSLSGDVNSGGVLTPGVILAGTYTVDASGRVLVTKTGHGHPAIAIYLISSNTGFAASGGSDVSFGFVEPQAGGPNYTNASLSGAFFFGTAEQTEANVSDDSGVANFDGTGTVNGTSDSASIGSTPSTNPFSQPYSVSNGTGTPGRGTITKNGNINLIFYIISSSKVILISVDNGNGTPDANPGLAFGQK